MKVTARRAHVGRTARTAGVAFIARDAADAAASLGTSIAPGGQMITMVYTPGCQQDAGAYVSSLDNTVIHWCQDPAALDFAALLVTMHEIGHVLGAHHVTACESLMYPAVGDENCNSLLIDEAYTKPDKVRYSAADLAEICAHSPAPTCPR